MNFIDVYLQGYSSKLWFYCVRIEDWGYVAQYLKCIDPKFEGVCPNPWSGGIVEPHDLLATTTLSNIFFEGDCNTRDELIQGPSNETSLIHAFWEGHSEWEENTWNFFKLYYLDPISGVISNDAYSAQEKHTHIFILIKDFLRAELEDNSWFTCLHIENWGTIADYLNCETGDKGYTCQLQTSLHQ
uniref:Uncharacterized protein n=1 Tax=Acrobeloides nanus TaxID=290746 RepID=A0A914DAJ9_9BILA